MSDKETPDYLKPVEKPEPKHKSKNPRTITRTVRPTDETDLPDPNWFVKPSETERHLKKGSKDEARLLKRVGERIKPEGMKYIGSAAVHIYVHPLDPTRAAFVSQDAGLDPVPQRWAENATVELGRHLANRYGAKIPRRLTEKPLTSES